jgi:hypothetical protein
MFMRLCVLYIKPSSAQMMGLLDDAERRVAELEATVSLQDRQLGTSDATARQQWVAPMSAVTATSSAAQQAWCRAWGAFHLGILGFLFGGCRLTVSSCTGRAGGGTGGGPVHALAGGQVLAAILPRGIRAPGAGR